MSRWWSWRALAPSHLWSQAEEKAMIKLLYKPVSVLIGFVSGILARTIFRRIWRLTAREDDAPEPTDARHSWRKVLLAAALQGTISAVIKAAVDRGAAVSTRKMTGVWPGNDGEEPGTAGG